MMERWLRTVVPCAVLLLQACAGRSPQTPPAPADTFAFVAQSAPDSLLEARFEGTAAVRDGWISVVVPTSVVTFPPGRPENWRSLTIRAFLAVDYRPGLWKAPVESRPVNVFRFIDFASAPTSTRRSIPIGDTLRFLVPIPPGASLATSRLAFEAEWVTVFGAYGETESRFAFASPLRP